MESLQNQLFTLNNSFFAKVISLVKELCFSL